MRRRNFMKLAGVFATIPVFNGIAATEAETTVKNKEIYEWRIYTLNGSATALDTFFEEVLIPGYSNFETYLCEAFDKIPHVCMPDKNRTMLELRIYHSPNEEANQRKVKMFNVDEIDVFDKSFYSVVPVELFYSNTILIERS